MNVDDIKLINFRNYENIYLQFNKNLNIFIGKNAQGKTNLIESIYMCGTGKSFRTNKDKEIINFEKIQAYIGSNISLNQNNKFVEIKMEKDKPKRIRVNKTELKSYKELYTGLNVVVFYPEDLRIIKDGPSERRNYIDKSLSQIKPVYNYNIMKYKKLLFQRNNLLKSSRFKDDILNLLDIFDVQIANIASSIIVDRNNYIGELNTISRETHKDITNKREVLEIKYITNIPILEDKKEMEEVYLRLLKENLKRDLEIRTTEIGPHRDDLIMNINGNDAKIFGSQGQQRTVVLSMILSEVDLIKKQRGMYPVLLLDDVFSELDEERKIYLSRFFSKMQTFITLTDGEDLKSLDSFNKSIFRVDSGNLKMESCV